MSFEKFVPTKKRGVAPKPPVVKVLKGGQISLNSAAYQQFLKGATHIELFYDSSLKKIGLQPKKYKTKPAFIAGYGKIINANVGVGMKKKDDDSSFFFTSFG